MTTTTTADAATEGAGGARRLVAQLNGPWHRKALWVFFAVVVAHWAEHLVQAFQIWVSDTPRPEARGVVGELFPVLISEEWLHYGYALVMLVGLILLRPGMTGQARTWWTIALALQFWHHIEHLLLFTQAATDTPFFGKDVPTSVVQLLYPRVELHLFYNAVVFVPMAVAMYLHMVPPVAERNDPVACGCRLKAIDELSHLGPAAA
ncbi:MAG TPA: hypothetical protein VGO60_00355 [Iamia sp.]|jgi:hypothetical protein|nr:hypothetical protein [Iamia sp.]